MSKHWCFTLNNYQPDEVEAIDNLDVQYIIYGFEQASTPHLQGYVQLHKQSRLNALKKLIPRAHWESMRGTPDQAAEYCQKEGNFKERGERCSQGKRNDLRAAMDAIKEGTSMKRLREEHPEICAKYPRFVIDYVRDQLPIPEVVRHPLNVWQQELYVKLTQPPNDREIIFVIDPDGNKGKTWFSKYYCALHENAQILESAKKVDMAYALRQDIRVLFVSCTRTMAEYLPYSFLESVKDGMVFSSKYESGVKLIPPCHVVVMMNQSPDQAALSIDRYNKMYV